MTDIKLFSIDKIEGGAKFNINGSHYLIVTDDDRPDTYGVVQCKTGRIVVSINRLKSGIVEELYRLYFENLPSFVMNRLVEISEKKHWCDSEKIEFIDGLSRDVIQAIANGFPRPESLARAFNEKRNELNI